MWQSQRVQTVAENTSLGTTTLYNILVIECRLEIVLFTYLLTVSTVVLNYNSTCICKGDPTILLATIKMWIQWRCHLWDTRAHAPSTSNSFIFSSLWTVHWDSQLSKYYVVCKISWCRCQQLTALSTRTAVVAKLLVIDQLLQLALKSTVSAPWPNFQLCLSSQQILTTPILGMLSSTFLSYFSFVILYISIISSCNLLYLSVGKLRCFKHSIQLIVLTTF